MGNKKFNKKILLLCLITITSFSCSRFEDGPLVSLLTVKQRLSRDWKVEYVIDIASGVHHSADYYGWNLSFKKDGSFTNSIIYNLVPTNYSGKWEFEGKNQLRLEYTVGTENVVEFYTITRLTTNELWVNNLTEETHYYSD